MLLEAHPASSVIRYMSELSTHKCSAFFDDISIDCGSIWTFFTVLPTRKPFLVNAGVKCPVSFF